jgi:anti-sigma-K factor RskA
MDARVMTTFNSKLDSPYVAASAALRSEYERLAQSNRMMRHSLIATAVALALSSAISLYLAQKPRAVPDVVELDKAGEVTGL